MENIPDDPLNFQFLLVSSNDPLPGVAPCQSHLIEDHEQNRLDIPLNLSGNAPAIAITNRTATD